MKAHRGRSAAGRIVCAMVGVTVLFGSLLVAVARPAAAFVRGPVFHPAVGVVAAAVPDATSVMARVGDRVLVPFNTCTTSCGARWVVTNGPDSSVVRYVSTAYRRLSGAPDGQTVTFAAVRAGTTTATWAYRQANGATTRRFTFTFRVASLLTFTSQEVKWAAALPPGDSVALQGVRVGAHGSFDRVVFDVRGGLPGYDASVQPWIRTVSSPDRFFYVRGLYFLQVTLENATPVARPVPVLRTGFAEVLEVRYAGSRGAIGSFPRVVSYGLVLRNLRAFRAFRLSSPDRLVIDVLH